MIRAKVIGEVWATRRAPRFDGKKWLLVAEIVPDERGSGTRSTGRVVVAADRLDAGVGEEVIVSFGSGARNAMEPGSREVLVDAAVVQIIDGTSADPEA